MTELRGCDSEGEVDTTRVFRSILDGTASFESRAALESELLQIVRSQGVPGVANFLATVSGLEFEPEPTDVEGEHRWIATALSANLRVTIFASASSLSVNVEAVSRESAPSADPRHSAFYRIWESLLGTSVGDVSELDQVDRAVYLVGLLEAEVMNGGLGQYLTNTDGIHVEATVQCLKRINATRTAAVLAAAAELGRRADSFGSAWDSEAPALQALDDEFLRSGEDLAGLVADAYRLVGRSGPV